MMDRYIFQRRFNGDWDKGLKSLVADCPQAFAKLILSRLEMQRQSIQSIAQFDTHFQGYDLDADVLLLVTLEEQEEILLHIELRKLLAFDYLCIKLYEEESQKLFALKQPALLPLALLTKGGASRTIVAGVFEELQANGLRNLFPVTNLLASLVFQKDQSDLDWLERKYREMTSISRICPRTIG